MSVVMQSLLLLYRPTDCNAAQAHRSGRLRDLKSFPLVAGTCILNNFV